MDNHLASGDLGRTRKKRCQIVLPHVVRRPSGGLFRPCSILEDADGKHNTIAAFTQKYSLKPGMLLTMGTKPC